MHEELILSSLIFEEGYSRKVIPFLNSSYFSDKSNKIIFECVNDYVQKYNKIPSQTALLIEVEKAKNVSDEEVLSIKEKITEFKRENLDCDWLVDETETFCKQKAIYNAIANSIKILDGSDKIHNTGHLPAILEEALAVSFDTHIGHDFIDDAEERYEFYHRKESRIPFNLIYLDKITKGGLPRKTLNVILAGTGVGKSLFMCNGAASNVSAGYNVLYITLEMAEERIAERIDSNLMNVPLDQLTAMPRDVYMKKIESIKSKIKGKLVIKEYPTSTASAANFRHLLNELRIKKKFTPDIIYIDYLNICSSSRLKSGSNVNSYTYVKAIAEELRGMAVEYNVPVVSATQTTRSGYTSTDLGLEDTSESFGLPATVDLMLALINSDELESLNQIMVKQLKNRYADPTFMKRFVIGVDRAKMRLYDVEYSAQEDVVDDSPAFDKASEKKLKKDVFKDFH
jgi:replicative DNA helicase